MLTIPEDIYQNAEPIILSGEMPSPLNPPSGCRFHTRCSEAQEIFSQEEPEMMLAGKHYVKCHTQHYLQGVTSSSATGAEAKFSFSLK